MGKKRKCEIR